MTDEDLILKLWEMDKCQQEIIKEIDLDFEELEPHQQEFFRKNYDKLAGLICAANPDVLSFFMCMSNMIRLLMGEHPVRPEIEKIQQGE